MVGWTFRNSRSPANNARPQRWLLGSCLFSLSSSWVHHPWPWLLLSGDPMALWHRLSHILLFASVTPQFPAVIMVIRILHGFLLPREPSVWGSKKVWSLLSFSLQAQLRWPPSLPMAKKPCRLQGPYTLPFWVSGSYTQLPKKPLSPPKCLPNISDIMPQTQSSSSFFLQLIKCYLHPPRTFQNETWKTKSLPFTPSPIIYN